MNMNIFTTADIDNLKRLACLFDTADSAELFMSAHEFRNGVSHAIEHDFGDANVTGAMFANVARKFFQSYRDSAGALGEFVAAKNIADMINSYINRNTEAATKSSNKIIDHEKITAFEHRDTGEIYRKRNGAVERENCNGEWIVVHGKKTTDLNSWPFIRINGYTV